MGEREGLRTLVRHDLQTHREFNPRQRKRKEETTSYIKMARKTIWFVVAFVCMLGVATATIASESEKDRGSWRKKLKTLTPTRKEPDEEPDKEPDEDTPPGWTPVANKASRGYADDDSTKYTLPDAIAKCTELGPKVCPFVTCEPNPEPKVKYCAHENGLCQCRGMARYGDGDNSKTKKVTTGSIECTSNAFAFIELGEEVNRRKSNRARKGGGGRKKTKCYCEEVPLPCSCRASAELRTSSRGATSYHRPDNWEEYYAKTMKYGLCVKDVMSNFNSIAKKGTKLGIWTGGKKSIFPWLGSDLQKNKMFSHIQSVQRLRTADGRNNYFVFSASTSVPGGVYNMVNIMNALKKKKRRDYRGAVLLVGKIESSKDEKDRKKKKINPTPIREGDNGPIISNKFYKEKRFRRDEHWFQKHDKIVAVVDAGKDAERAHGGEMYFHPGGITAMDDINVVAVGIDNLPKEAATSRVLFYDFENPEDPKYLKDSDIKREAPPDKKRGNPAPTIAITSLPSKRNPKMRHYLLVIGNLFEERPGIMVNRKGAEFQFYESRDFDPSKGREDNPIFQGDPEWNLFFERKISDTKISPSIQHKIKQDIMQCKKSARKRNLASCLRHAAKFGELLNFQTMNFVRQCDDDALYLVGFARDSGSFSKIIGKGGEDRAQLLKVDLKDMSLTLEDNRHFKCDDACNFDGGSGIYLAEDSKSKGTARMLFYGSEHWPSSPGTWGKVKDFAPGSYPKNNKVIRMNEFS